MFVAGPAAGGSTLQLIEADLTPGRHQSEDLAAAGEDSRNNLRLAEATCRPIWVIQKNIGTIKQLPPRRPGPRRAVKP